MASFPILVTNDAAWSQDFVGQNAGSVGPFGDGSNRYLVLQDLATHKMRCYKRAGAGAFAEVDAAGAPACADDAGAPAPGIFNYYGVVQNRTAQKLYVVYWAADFTIRLTVFSTATDTWGASFASALTYLFPDLGVITANLGNMGVAYRASDDSVWMMFCSGGDVLNPPFVGRVSGAKCALSGAGWDVALQPFGSVDIADERAWSSFGMVADSADNIHCFFVANNSAPATLPVGSGLYHQVLHPDDTFSAIDAIMVSTTPVSGGGARFSLTSYPSISTGDVLMFTTQSPNATQPRPINVIRAVAGDAPVWVVETPADIQNPSATVDNRLKGTVSDGGLDVVFYTTSVAGLVSFLYIASAGIGQPWAAPALLGTVDTTVPNVAISLSVEGAVTGSIGITMPFTDSGSTSGQGFFELAAAVQPIIRAQVIFQGVRRQRGRAPGAGMNFKPKPFSYVLAGSLTADATAAAVAPLVLIQTINDYDFDLYQLKITYSSGAALPRVVCAINLFDAVKNSISNMPIHDVYWNGAPGSEYQNGALVVPLYYPRESQIRLELFSLVGAANLPVAVRVECVGVQRFPC